MDKVLSVIIPVFNMEELLPKCIGSLLAASECQNRLEILVVNDGSKDRTSDVAHGFEARYPDVVRVIDKPNGNYGSCINAALPRVRGCYIKVVDADDYVDPPAFAALMAVLDEEACRGTGAADLVTADYCRVDPHGKVLTQVIYDLPEGVPLALADKKTSERRFETHSITYRTKILREMDYRQSEGLSYTDTEWIIEPMTRVRRLRHLRRPVVRYLVGRAGQTTEVATFCECFQQLVDITTGLVARSARRLAEAEPSARGYYWDQLVWTVMFVYRSSLLRSGAKRPCVDLARFEAVVQAHPDLVEITQRQGVRGGVFRYVEEWRKKGTTRTWRFAVFDIGAKTVDFLRRLK